MNAGTIGSTDWKRRLESEIAARLAELDRCGIRTQALYAPWAFATPDSLNSSAGIGALNDALAAVASAAPGRLECFAHVDFDDGTRGVGAVEAALSRGFCGVAVPTRHREHRLDEAFFRPFLEYADRHGIPVLVRSTGLQGSGPCIDERQQNNVGVHGDLGVCLARMIFAGVLEELPQLALYLDQGGGILPGLVARLDHGYEVRKECRALLPSPPSSYLRNVYVDGAAMDAATFKCAIGLLGPAQIIFASDAADCALERSRIEGLLAQTDAVAASGVNSLLDDNARRLFGFGGRSAH